MRIGKAVSILGAAAVLSLQAWSLSGEALAGVRGPIRLAEMQDGNGGSAVNLTVWKLTVRPIHAHVGDVIDVEVWIDNREDGSETTWAKVYANGKEVAREPFRWGTPGMDHNYKLFMQWDTRGMAPGSYNVKVEAFVFQDSDPFDNEMTLKQPVILVEPGGKLPGGEPGGAGTTEIDPRYK